MSGLKTGILETAYDQTRLEVAYEPIRLRAAYDPTPTRINDLENYAAEQDAWLERHGSFIRAHLGERAYQSAQEALRRVYECINADDPDAGFDYYGDTWRLFNHLHQQAWNVKQRERRCEKQKREKAVKRSLSTCRELWENADNQALLRQWSNHRDLQGLQASLTRLRAGTGKHLQQRIKAWRKRFDQTLQEALRASQANFLAVRERVSELRAALDGLDRVNTNALPDAEQYLAEKKRLKQQAEENLQQENLQGLVESIDLLNELARVSQQKISEASFERKVQAVNKALSACRYSVSSRTEADGTVVFQARAFPLKSVYVHIHAKTDEMKLDVKDERGTHCVEDVESLQAELAREGMRLTITDWGGGNPQGVREYLRQNLVVGGAI